MLTLACMAAIRRALLRIVSLFRSAAAEAELSREIHAHLQLLEDEFAAKGMTRSEARYAAKRAFGGVEQTKERQRDARSFTALAGWPMDLKLGVRMLRKTPGLTAIAVVALAVAIGAGAAYVEFMNDMLFPTFPVADSHRVVGIRVWDTSTHRPQTRVLADFAVWRKHAETFEFLGAERHFYPHVITDDGRTDSARGVEISAAAFQVVPTPALLGRTLTADDERAAAPPVVVIGHDLWSTRFNRDSAVLGRVVRLGSVAHTIVGVMPEGFAFPTNHNLWTPLKAQPAGVQRGEGPYLWLFGKLKERTTPDIAEAELRALAGGVRVRVQPYLDSLLSEDRGSGEVAIVRAGNIVFVLLLAICGANVATLVFARTLTREAELTVRTALGASRTRISAQLFAEALVLAGIAAIVGLAVAAFISKWATQAFVQGTGQPRPFWWNDNLGPQTILYACALAVFAAAIVGIVPAMKATGGGLQARLRAAGGGQSTMNLGWMWTGVIVVQAAITVMFLAAVGSLAVNTARSQTSLDVTYPRGQFLTMEIRRGDAAVGGDALRRSGADTLRAIAERLADEPGVINATYATSVPDTTFEMFPMELADSALDAEANARKRTDELWVESAHIGPRFFETLGVPLAAGRLFTNAEILDAHQVAIVDETFVRLVLGGRNAIGVRVRRPARESGAPGPWFEVVGVVGDVTVGARKGPQDAVIYLPAGTEPSPARLLVRTQGPAAALSHKLQAAALSAAPDVRLVDPKSLAQRAEDDALPGRLLLRVVAVTAAVALLLSTAGIYALVSFTLARRTREIGIRMALGAAPRRIITGVFSRAFSQVGLGVLAGALPGVVIIMEGLKDARSSYTAASVILMCAVCALVVLVAAISCAAPLRRALRIEPTQALRTDG